MLAPDLDQKSESWIEDRSLVLVRQQPTAEDKEIVVALVDEAMINELRRSPDAVAIVPRSDNPKHHRMVLRRDF